MIEKIPTPRDLAEKLEWQTEVPVEQHEGDIVEIDGAEYRLVPFEPDYTFLGWYSHHHPETGEPGPGWDSRYALADPETAMKEHGRTFTLKQVFQPGLHMPDKPMFTPIPINEDERHSVAKPDPNL